MRFRVVARTLVGLIAREMALDIAFSTYSPDIVQHLPGVANLAAGALSRRYQPGNQGTLPTYLTPDKECRVKKRNRSWWRTIPAWANLELNLGICA